MDSVEGALSEAVRGCDYVLVDTPGTFFLSSGLRDCCPARAQYLRAGSPGSPGWGCHPLGRAPCAELGAGLHSVSSPASLSPPGAS